MIKTEDRGKPISQQIKMYEIASLQNQVTIPGTIFSVII
jgi:hypothetical protein